MEIEQDKTSSSSKQTKINSNQVPRNVSEYESSNKKSPNWNRLSVDYIPSITTQEKFSSRLNSSSSINSTTNQKTTIKKLNKKKLRTPCQIFKDAIPKMSKPLAIICCIANILIPGLGKYIHFFVFTS
jgi:hypothetical protein